MYVFELQGSDLNEKDLFSAQVLRWKKVFFTKAMKSLWFSLISGEWAYWRPISSLEEMKGRQENY